MANKSKVERFETSGGGLIFRLPLEVFPQYIAYAHLISYDDKLALVDVGSGFGSCHADLVAGLETVRAEHGIPASLENVHQIIISHGHVDHFGGLAQVKAQAPQAEVGLHELSRPVLVNYDERVLITRTAMADFLARAGVPLEHRQRLLDMYMLGKRAFPSVPVDFTLHDGDVIDNRIHVIHVPGHAPGLVMLQVDDVLLVSDHILPETSVALAPESIMPYTGVGHYIESLAKAEQVQEVRVALGGHEQAMDDFYAIVRRTRQLAQEKVARVLEHCDEPRTIYEIALRIYGGMDGYSELLKIEQTGARIEYLNQRGMVMIENLTALEQEHSPALRYRRV